MDDRINCMGRREMIKQLCGIVLSGLAWPRLLLKLQNGKLQSLFICPIQVVAIGSGACNILDHIIEIGIQGLKSVSIGPDPRYVQPSQADSKIQIGRRLRGGFGCYGEPDLGKQAALEQAPRIKDAIRSSRTNVIIACLGGGTGTGAGPLVAEWSIASGAETFVVVTMPFDFEGKKRYEQALNGLRGFQRRVKLLHIHYNKVASEYRHRPVTEVYNLNDEAIVASCKTFILEAKQSGGLSVSSCARAIY